MKSSLICNKNMMCKLQRISYYEMRGSSLHDLHAYKMANTENVCLRGDFSEKENLIINIKKFLVPNIISVHLDLQSFQCALYLTNVCLARRFLLTCSFQISFCFTYTLWNLSGCSVRKVSLHRPSCFLMNRVHHLQIGVEVPV